MYRVLLVVEFWHFGPYQLQSFDLVRALLSALTPRRDGEHQRTVEHCGCV
jgi:hypothetical protein